MVPQGCSIGQRVFGLTDWYRDGALAEYIAVEARNLAPLPADVDFTVGASLVMSGLTALAGTVRSRSPSCRTECPCDWCGGHCRIDGGALAREAGAYVIGTGRGSGRQTALDFGANEFVDPDNDGLKNVGPVDLVFDVLGGDVVKQSAALLRAGGTLVTIAGPTEAGASGGQTIDFVVEPNSAQLTEIVRRVREGRLRPNIGTIVSLDATIAAFNPATRAKGKTIIRVRP
ncbi:zinc-binding dehydrogenase [Puia sp. P3]|uniref:zinc-binding dehydrogenase n=1 Tax=Puia sp. P3 TaxID=3423952 RepID=UPI003D674BEF